MAESDPKSPPDRQSAPDPPATIALGGLAAEAAAPVAGQSTAEAPLPGTGRLTIRINVRAHKPIYFQLVESIQNHIATGRLKPGDQLPPVRKLAEFLNINPNTVDKAYQELHRLHLVETQQGRGTFVTATAVPPPATEDLEARRLEAVNTFINTMTMLGCTKPDILTRLINRLNLS